ncbi:MAG TPA: Hsp33 family molecular chaperone HslO [Pyrinomonadaceae bacterium]|nr:Hsp33 family molecular chaperone HslO [Pyrinomonadaceae bacterium]
MDKLIHATAADGTIRVLAVITTEIVREAVRRHQTSPTASVALGRVLTGTLLLGSSLKDFDRLTVKIECDGVIEGIVAETTAQGKVRGYVRNPLAESSENAVDVKEVIGKGMFHVIREIGFDVGSYSEPYHGSVPLYTGEIGDDFAYYLLKSEQIPSAVMLGVSLQTEDPFIEAAGGVMLQIMPGANDHLITMIEDTIAHAPHLSTVIKEGATPEDLVKLALGIIDYEILEEKEVEFKCNCSPERAVALIGSLGKAEVESMLHEDKGASMTCGFCNRTYQLEEKDLENILNSLS